VRSRLSEYFNTNCFTPPPVISPSDGGTGFGNSSPGIMRGPSQHNVDFSLRKNTRLTERAALEFRAEFFNAFNSTQFGNPDTTFTDGPAFGQNHEHVGGTACRPTRIETHFLGNRKATRPVPAGIHFRRSLLLLVGVGAPVKLTQEMMRQANAQITSELDAQSTMPAK
jgi:hypothetical protein